MIDSSFLPPHPPHPYRALAVGLLKETSHHHRNSRNAKSDANINIEHFYDNYGDADEDFFVGSFSDETEQPSGTGSSSTKTWTGPRSVERCLGLDLAFNAVGHTGIAALTEALAATREVVFLELRGNKSGDLPDGGSDEDVDQSYMLLKQAEKICADRRRQLRYLRKPRREQLLLRDLARVKTSPGTTKSAGQLGVGKAGGGGGWGRGGAGNIGTGRKVGRLETAVPTACSLGLAEVARKSERYRLKGFPQESSSLAENCRSRRMRPGAAFEGTTTPHGSRGCSATKPRPLEGAPPVRGYYVSPLLDSYFDLLMLREPAPDPADKRFYVNRTRDELERRRIHREREDSGGSVPSGDDRTKALGKGDQGSGMAQGRVLTPFSKGAVGETPFLKSDELYTTHRL